MSCTIFLVAVVVAFFLATSDYAAMSQEVVFPTGAVQTSVAIPIVNDSVLEATESFSLRLTIPVSLAGVLLLGEDVATVSITDDDSK